MPNAINGVGENYTLLNKLLNASTFDSIGKANLEMTRNQENNENRTYSLVFANISAVNGSIE